MFLSSIFCNCFLLKSQTIFHGMMCVNRSVFYYCKWIYFYYKTFMFQTVPPAFPFKRKQNWICIKKKKIQMKWFKMTKHFSWSGVIHISASMFELNKKHKVMLWFRLNHVLLIGDVNILKAVIEHYFAFRAPYRKFNFYFFWNLLTNRCVL